jgi:hypothetical protein
MRKKYTEQNKLKAKLGGIHSSNVAQLKKINKLTITKEKPKVPTSKLYMYMNKKWQYKGLLCRFCGLTMTDQLVVDNHQYICKVLNTKTEDE